MLGIAALVGSVHPAFAQGVAGSPNEANDTDQLVDAKSKRSWSTGIPRPFIAASVDAGFLYLRPRISLGYGKPFNTWFGIDVNPVASSAGLGAYSGLRFAIPNADLRVGARYFTAFEHRFLPARDRFERLDLENAEFEKASLVTLETELNLSFHAGPGDVIALGSLSYVANVPDDLYVFEETLHVIVAPPIVWRARGGYALRVAGKHSVGLVADFLDVPKRDDSLTVRVGPVISIQLSRHFDVRGSFVVPIFTPDRIGLVGGDFTELGVRFRAATE